MFEFRDSKLGKVKVVNITEARQNMAAIMNDGEFNYIITKNNKPIRVIINYQEYKEVKAFQKEEIFSNQIASSNYSSTPLKEKIQEKPSHRENILESKPIKTSFDHQKSDYHWSTDEELVLDQDHLEEENHQTQKMIDVIENEQKNLTPAEKAYFERFKKLYSKAHQENLKPQSEPLSDFADTSSLPKPSFKKESSAINWDNELSNFQSNSTEPSFEELKALRENLGKTQSTSETKKETTQHSAHLYQNNEGSSEMIQKTQPLVKENSYQPPKTEKIKETSYTKPQNPPRELPQKDMGGFEPPSIQDLLKELENEKLSGE